MSRPHSNPFEPHEKTHYCQGECPICKQEIEFLSHALWECLTTSDMWGEARCPVRNWGGNICNFQDLWTKISESLSSYSLALCYVIFRHIWMRRNTFMHEGNFIHPKLLMSNAVQQLEKYHEACGLTHNRDLTSSTSLGSIIWQPPNLGQIKFNWDEVAKRAMHYTGIGGLSRDSACEVLVASSSSYPWALPLDIVKTLAFRQALLLLRVTIYDTTR